MRDAGRLFLSPVLCRCSQQLVPSSWREHPGHQTGKHQLLTTKHVSCKVRQSHIAIVITKYYL
jgi:hypothetical protein